MCVKFVSIVVEDEVAQGSGLRVTTHSVYT